jgi:hypothetical protein
VAPLNGDASKKCISKLFLFACKILRGDKFINPGCASAKAGGTVVAGH